MTIAVRAAAWHAALDVVRLRARRVWNRITGLAAPARIALVAVAHERDGRARFRLPDAHVRDAVRRRAEIGMGSARAPDAVDERGRLRVDGRAADVLIPPVVGRKERAA